MVNPQKEKGFTPIANEIVDKFCQYRLSGEEWLVLWVILRKTYGWNKKEDIISLSQFSIMTGMKRPSVIRAIKKLVTKKLLASNQKATKFGNKYRFNKDFDSWHVVTKQLPRGFKWLPNGKRGSNQIANEVVTNRLHTKDTIQKTLLQKTVVTPTKEILSYFYSKYEEVFKKKYVASFGKDGKLFKDLLKVIPIENLKKLINAYFLLTDDFVEKTGYSIGVFKTRINSLQIDKRTLLMSEKGIKSTIALKGWLEKEGENAK